MGSYLLVNALDVASCAHAGMVDRAGVDYMSHVNAVVAGVAAAGGSEIAMVVAALHDVVEDTEVSLDEIEMMFGDEVAVAVGLLTKNGASNEEYYAGIAGNELARVVKLADMAHNSDLSRLPNPTAEDYARCEKYAKWTAYLA